MKSWFGFTPWRRATKLNEAPGSRLSSTTLECELLDRRSLRSQAEARMAVFAFIEGFYNPARRHSALGYLSSIEYEVRAMVENEWIPTR